ncbi:MULTISPECIES: hypothetical protein [Vitreoscilla]|uniref:Uncharacterized protein n=1 Tax=Vitreoscilla stercoraria TaxID=61 RepID=A0ABY4EBL9_VITST|nr:MULTISPECIES: hypothetical protein [Vitreoscilla]AUZ04043.1 hypothetical protein ADP71_02210 [Vitreoscilla sp. C1]UOO93145.1 hypothetical protein LVJ81_03685 [Vitreoscilla stercoraria]
MELHSNLYYKHPNTNTMDVLDALFLSAKDNEAAWLALAAQLNAEQGASLAQELWSQVDEPEFDLNPESSYRHEGYSIAHFVHGSMGDENMEAILEFLLALLPDIQAQAWGCGDDDPWEFWFKFNEQGQLVRKDDEPYQDEEEDEHIQATIYAWWHKGLPESIKEGFLNETDAADSQNTF